MHIQSSEAARTHLLGYLEGVSEGAPVEVVNDSGMYYQRGDSYFGFDVQVGDVLYSLLVSPTGTIITGLSPRFPGLPTVKESQLRKQIRLNRMIVVSTAGLVLFGLGLLVVGLLLAIP